jgi:hypothetical protein
MASLISFCLSLIALLAGTSRPAEEPAPSLRVFADFKHLGKLTEPSKLSAMAPDEFGIAVPLSARIVDRGRLPDNPASGDRFAEKLGRLRVEMATGGANLAVSIESRNDGQFRLFQRAKAEWRRLPPNKDLSWTLAPGSDRTVEIGVGVMLPQARQGDGQPSWPRIFDVIVSSTAQRGKSLRVPFRVAPFVIPSAVEPVEELMIVSLPVTADAVRGVLAFSAKPSVKLVVHEVQGPSDQWMQDTIQPGLFAFPAAMGTEQARASLTGLRKESRASAAKLDYQVVRWLRRHGVVTVAAAVPRENTRWIDGYGNLESTPPHTDRQGRHFPYGRLIVGKQRELTMHPDVMEFLKSQRVQWPPIVADTSWLAIGHVDEVVNFVPAKTTAGFKVLLPSPKAARELLETLLANGLEGAPLFAGTESEMTLGKLRMTIAGTSENLAIDDAIAHLRRQLKRELNLDDSDFVMLPALFQRGVAVIPNAVNSMVVNDALLVAEPRGPRQDGKDAFETAIRTALSGCDVRVVFIDSWNAYHTAGGEIHCGTNTFRRLRDPAWWKYKYAENGERKGN